MEAMAANAVSKLTIDEFLDMERRTESRSEYLDGVVYPAVAATYPHGVIGANVIRRLGALLDETTCTVAGAGAFIEVLPSSFVAVPDAFVVCGKPRYGGPRDAVTNPVLIVEVLSPSTESWDRGTKFKHYRRIDTLQEFVLVSQAEYQVEVFRRERDRWAYFEFEGPDAELRLESIDCTIPLRQIYEKVDFTAE